MVIITEFIRPMRANAVAANTMVKPWSHKESGVWPFPRRGKARRKGPTRRKGWTAKDHESEQDWYQSVRNTGHMVRLLLRPTCVHPCD